MSEIYDDYLARKMSRAEALLLTPEEKRERLKAKKRIERIRNKETYKKYYQEYDQTPERKKKLAESKKKYNQTPAGKKARTISSWVCSGIKETKEDLDRIYNLWLTQELCNACDCILTRDGRASTQASMDHCHISHRFRHIICSACNTYDNWKKYFC